MLQFCRGETTLGVNKRYLLLLPVAMLLTCGSLNQVLEQSSKALENSDQAIGELRELVRALSLTFNELVDFVKSAWNSADTNQDGSTSMWEIIMYIILGHSAVEGGKKGIGKIKNGTRSRKDKG